MTSDNFTRKGRVEIDDGYFDNSVAIVVPMGGKTNNTRRIELPKQDAADLRDALDFYFRHRGQK